jgi:hypothetical protein
LSLTYLEHRKNAFTAIKGRSLRRSARTSG